MRLYSEVETIIVIGGGVRGHMGRVGGDGDGRVMRKWAQKGKCMGRGDGAFPPFMYLVCAVNC